MGRDKSAASHKRNVPPAQAQHEFETRCSACHGLDGRGGEHAPNISTNPAVRRLSEHEIFKLVHDGILSKGMPAFDYLSDHQIKSIVNYMRFMAGQSGWERLKGDPLQGDTLFFGKAGCGECHLMHGKGGFLGSDLTEYARTHMPDKLREAILNPGKLRDSHQENVEIVTRAGERLSGVIRNEDNFSLQLLGVDGRFHMLSKSDVDHMNRNGNQIMSSDYGRRLSAGELKDLISYIAQGASRTEGESPCAEYKRPRGATPRRNSKKQRQSD